MTQLAYFPTPLPGEDFRSILYRYHLQAMNKEITDTNIELFGAKSEFTIFPRNLGLLLNKLPQGFLSFESVIQNHTLLPWFLPFLPDSHKDRVINEIKNGGNLNESSVGKLAGNKYGRCIDVDIKYCPLCLEEDDSEYGSGYIHREHQFAFIHKCNKHNILLVSECRCGCKLGYGGIKGECSAGHRVELQKVSSESVMQDQIIEDLEAIVFQKDKLSLSFIRQRLVEHLFYKGYISSNVKIRRKLLVSDFLKYYSLDQLLSMGLTEEYIMQRNTFERVLWKDSITCINLSIMLLLFRFIGGSFSKFISRSNPYALQIPFGCGPWYCENKYCPDYRELVIKQIRRVDNKHRGVSGIFKCPTCDTEYRKFWSWKNQVNIKKLNLYSSAEKRKKVIEFFRNGCPINEIARELYCSENTLKKIIKKQTVNIENCTTFEPKHLAKRNAYRARIEKVMKNEPNLSRNEICARCSGPYQWLKKFDTEWLEKRLPESRSTTNFKWEKVDEAISKRVKEVAAALTETNPSTRVGTYSILNALSKTESGRIKNYSKFLPRTRKTLEEVVETKEQYQIRHLPALVRQLTTHYNYKIVTLEIIQSYRRSYRDISLELQEKLSYELSIIQGDLDYW
ncbi:TnsD family Tn7-like transposition protein [Paenibacillus nitricinens]|uniref:TnsD family Tn7-like transposition protein n=1 Tax=Paenibacillus nitricinens TaxID=3367691 RepID=UPI003F87AC3F